MSTTLQTCDPKDITLVNTESNYTLTGTNVSHLSVGNTSATSWSNPLTCFNNGSNTVMSIPASGGEVIIEPNSTLTVKGSIVMNGVDLDERLERIETLLHIPSRDVEMEKEFPKLKKLWEEYNAELEKYKTWKRLNK